MPYAPEHKEQTRARIVECARRMFNRHGFEAVSIDQIMASAGLTRGGFYHHFANKEALSILTERRSVQSTAQHRDRVPISACFEFSVAGAYRSGQ